MSGSDLLEFVEWPGLECLNQQPGHTIQNALKQGYREDDGLYLESDTDEQLLIHIPFQNACRLSGLVIKSSQSPEQAPKRVKLFVNRPTIGFSEAAELPGVQEWELTPEEVASGKPLALALVKFRAVNALSIFIESNQDDADTTRVEKVVVFGSSGDSFNVAAIKDVSKEQD